MKTKTKAFDCVEMKHKAQEELLAEFERRREEFATLTEFLNAKLDESERGSAIWARFGRETES